MATKKKKSLTLPKTAGGLADRLFKTRTLRLEASRVVDEYRGEEAIITEALIALLKGQDVVSVTGRLATFSYKKRPVPKIEDWDKFYAYIKRTGAFELLHRRVSGGAIAERWEAKKEVPGVVPIEIEVPSLKKAGGAG